MATDPDRPILFDSPETALATQDREPYHGWFVEIARTTPHAIHYGERVAYGKMAPAGRGWWEVTTRELERYVAARRRDEERRRERELTRTTPEGVK